MGRRSLQVANVAEVLEHWAAGRPLRAIAESLGLDRNTVRKYVTPAREAGFGPSSGAPPEGWVEFVARVCPLLGTAKRNGSAWDELAARRDEIVERLKVNRPSTVWQRMHDDGGLQASLPSFRRYALANFPEAYGRRPGITVLRDDPPPGEEALCGTPHSASYAASGNMRRPTQNRRRCSCSGRSRADGTPHNHRPSRNARSASDGRNRPGRVFGGAVRARACSLRPRSAWR